MIFKLDFVSSHYDIFVDMLSFYCRKLKIAQDEFEASEFFLDFLQSWTAFSKQHTQVDRIVCLGLGNFAQSPNSSSQVSSKFQLLLLLSFAKHANIAKNDEVFVYDPILTCSESLQDVVVELKTICPFVEPCQVGCGFST